jgi:putative redox protein
VKASLRHLGDLKFECRAEDAPSIVLHAPPKGTPKEGPSPVQASLLAAMACTASDVVWILQKERANVASLEVEATAERAPREPKVLTKMHFHFRVRGDGVRDSDVKRAIDLSVERYCSVGILFARGGVEWTNSHEILPAE